MIIFIQSGKLQSRNNETLFFIAHCKLECQIEKYPSINIDYCNVKGLKDKSMNKSIHNLASVVQLRDGYSEILRDLFGIKCMFVFTPPRTRWWLLFYVLEYNSCTIILEIVNKNRRNYAVTRSVINN